jgi:hypothetical protein
MDDNFIDELLKILTYGVGRKLGVSIRRQFYDCKKHIKLSETYKSLEDEQKEYIIICLALTMFNTHIIKPFRGASCFYKFISKQGVKSISISNGNLSQNDIGNLDDLIKHFHKILFDLRISRYELYFIGTEDFIRRILFKSSERNFDGYTDNSEDERIR